jgi:hypothetical protein
MDNVLSALADHLDIKAGFADRAEQRRALREQSQGIPD